MARITVEDCLEHVDNRFELVMKASKRARQLATGGKEPMVKEESDKATVIALREIADGLVTDAILQSHFEEEESFDFATGEEGAGEEDLEAASLVEAILEGEEASDAEAPAESDEAADDEASEDADDGAEDDESKAE